jgi:hypothetical protein
MKAAVITTFPNHSWEIYAKAMLQSFVQYWPKEIPLLVQLDDDLLLDQVEKIIRPQDAVAVGWEKEHTDFVERNKGKDDPTNYRKQAVRFCHKVFAIKRALDASIRQKEAGGTDTPRYLIWMDADVITQRPVSVDEIKECLPKEEDAVSYMGRKDWDHSECGWLAFDLENGGNEIIDSMFQRYKQDLIFQLEQWHDSYVWDCEIEYHEATNLTREAKGMDVWPQSPMGKWSVHHKGPVAKAKMISPKIGGTPIKTNAGNVIINTRNAIPHEQICAHIKKNQSLIKNWIRPCKKTSEEIVVVSAGPMLVAEDVRKEVKAGRRIVAVKHALLPLKKAGITPWACILLDPRPHVADFIQDADPNIIWFVASQVNPEVTLELLAKGCTVWGYHASVGAGEHELTSKQMYSVISGGSATATRGLFVLNHLGFSNMRLYGYDLCVPDKPDLNALDKDGQPKYLEMSLGMNDPNFNLKKCFWSEPQLIAQFEEINDLIKLNKFKLKAFGDGIVPFILKCQYVSNLRSNELKAKISGTKPPSYKELLYGNGSTSTSSRRKSSANT